MMRIIMYVDMTVLLGKKFLFLITVEEVLERNVASQRDDAIKMFIEQAKKDREAGYTIILGGDFNEPSHQDWTEETKNLYDHHGLVIPWTVPVLLE